MYNRFRSIRLEAVCTIAAVAFGAIGCTNLGSSPSRLGMVKDPATGLQIGSVVEHNFVTDPSFYKNRKVKVRLRNTSGDQAFDLYSFGERLRNAYARTGFEPTDSEDFGFLIDINVRYSGQVQRNLAAEYGFLGATAGGLAGASRGDLVAAGAGVAAGATLGSIIGSFVTDDTYIIVAEITVGIVEGPPTRDGKRITFSRSISGNPEDQEEYEERQNRRGFGETHRTKIAVYAGGRNVYQSEIAAQVRNRMVRIIGDII